MPTRSKRPISPEDLYRLHLSSDCRLSPDGQHVVYVVQRIERKTQKKYSNLWMAPTTGGRAWQFTHGDHMDSQPRWSPDGSQLAFLSNRDDEKQPQLYLIPVHGGEARRLTDLKGEIAMFAWSPTGKQFVCQVRKKDQEVVEREADEQKKKLGVVSRHITRVWYKLDGRGYLPKERWHIWTIDAATGKSTQLTDSDVYDEVAPCWSPDGKYVAFCCNRSKDPDLDPEVVDLFVISATGGDPRKIEAPLGRKTSPQFSPDGEWLAYYGFEGKGSIWKNLDLWVVPVHRAGEAKNLTAPFDCTLENLTLNDLYGFIPLVAPVWSNDGKRLFFPVTQQGNTLFKSLALNDEHARLQTVIGSKGSAAWFSFDYTQAKLVYFHADMAEPGQIWLRDLTNGRVRRLTQVNANFLHPEALGEVEEVWFKGPAGDDLQGWILKPSGFDPAQKYPAILEIHGGPHAQYGNIFMLEFYYLAAQGYVVFFCNPRGSQGYGAAHAKAVLHNWAVPAYEDLMAWTDTVCQRPYIDRERLGVTGGSYGGYMTNWIIGHTDRFQAAVTKRGVSNLISMYGSSDFNWNVQTFYGDDEPPWANFEHYWEQSPLKYIGDAKTPALVIHCEQDLRCAVEQAEQIFVALKKLGIDSELVLFPDESHGLSIGGRADRRIEQLNHVRRWFDRYLKKEERHG